MGVRRILRRTPIKVLWTVCLGRLRRRRTSSEPALREFVRRLRVGDCDELLASVGGEDRTVLVLDVVGATAVALDVSRRPFPAVVPLLVAADQLAPGGG